MSYKNICVCKGNNGTTFTMDANGNTVSYEYSGSLSTALGLATTVTDPKGIKNYYIYDMYGRLIKNSLENTSEIEYDYDKGQPILIKIRTAPFLP